MLKLIVRALAVLTVGAAVAAGLIVLMATNGMLKDQIGKLAADALKRPVTFGDARVKLGVPLGVHLEDVTLGNPAGIEGPGFLKAKSVDARVKLNWSPLFDFAPELADLELVAPVIDIRHSADGKSNLDFGGGGGNDGSLWPAKAKVTSGKVTLTAAGDSEPIALDDIDAEVTSEPATGKTSGKGRLMFKGEPVDFDVTFADLKIAMAGLPSAVTGTINTPHGKADLTGVAVVKGDPQYTGDATLESPSVKALAHWLDPAKDASGKPLPLSLKGKIKVRASELTLDETDLGLAGINGRATGVIAMGGERPKYTGSFATPRIDLSMLSSDGTEAPRSAAPEAAGTDEEIILEIEPDIPAIVERLREIETGAAPRAAAEFDTLEAPASPAEDDETRAAKLKTAKASWSNEKIGFEALKSADLDVALAAAAIDYGKLSFSNVKGKVKLDGGRLSAQIDEAGFAGGTVKGTLGLDAAATPPAVAIALSMAAVAAEPVISQLTGKPYLIGASNVDLDIKAAGESVNALASSLEGKAKFKMGKGALRGFDVKREAENFTFRDLLAAVFGGKKKTFKVNLAHKTNFEKLDADYDIRKGVLKSVPGLAVGGSEVEIKSSGEVSVARRFIDQAIRVKVVPPPKWPTIPVLISGPWEKPVPKLDISNLDVNSLINATLSGGAARSAAAEAAAPEEPVAPEVQKAIESLLAANVGSDRLSDDGKEVLRSFLPAGGAAPTDPAASPDAGSPAP